MNLTYVRKYLEARKDNITNADIEGLLVEIKEYQGTEDCFSDISKVMRTINEYNLSFLTKAQEYEAFPKNDSKTLPERMEKVREILGLLSMLHTYLILSLNNIKESTYNTKNIRTYLSDLGEKKEHFKSEKMTWVTILKSLTQEVNYVTEMRRLDLEDKMGYIKK